jgi:hypothetical protein
MSQTESSPAVRRVVVQYRAKPDCADENQRLAQSVFEELARDRPAGLRYATFRLDDGITFIHMAVVETADGSNPLDSVDAFKAFGREIASRCDVLPNASTAALVGSYGCF